ncbi:MAG TPA: ABC transporter permease [Roseiarcus sp.]|nr:ABC transporter permease [Roseiarcus sp.]
MVLACLAATIVFSLASPWFLTIENLTTVARASVELLIVSLGMTIVLAVGGIDLTVGVTMAIASFFVGRALMIAVPAPLAALLGPLVGIFLGAVTAGVIVLGSVPPIVATLGLYGVFRATIYALLGGEWLSGLPDVLAPLVRPTILGIPSVAFELAALYVLAWGVFRWTPLGVWWLAIGGADAASQLAGVPVRRAKTAAYLASGLLAGIAGAFYVAQYRNVEMTTGSTIALDAIVASVLGGASVTGGRVSVLGTALGVILFRILQNGFVLIGVPSLWEQVVAGLLLLAVLATENAAKLRALVMAR